MEEVVKPQLEVFTEKGLNTVEELRVKAMELIKPPVEHNASVEGGAIWRACFGNVADVPALAFLSAVGAMLLESAEEELELMAYLLAGPAADAALPQRPVKREAFVDLLRYCGPFVSLFPNLRALLQQPFYPHITIGEASALLHNQQPGSYLLRQVPGEVDFYLTSIDGGNQIRDAHLTTDEKLEGRHLFRFFPASLCDRSVAKRIAL